MLSCLRGSGIRKRHEGFKGWLESEGERHLSSITASNRSVLFVQHKPSVIEIDCYQIRRELSDYLEEDLTAQLRLQIEDHLQNCSHCRAVYDGMRNVVRLLGDGKSIELPEGFSRRLYKRLFPPC